MFGISTCFAAPIGYQTNTQVHGAGGNKFTDFPRVGLLLNQLLWVVAFVFYSMAVPFPIPELRLGRCPVLAVNHTPYPSCGL
jgi:di/tricarboxylate transporter